MKIIERVMEKRLRASVEVDEKQFGFILKRGTTDALFTVRRMQNKYREKGKKSNMFFLDLEKTFDRFPRRVMRWTQRKKGLPEILVKAVMSLYEGSKTKVKVGSEFS